MLIKKVLSSNINLILSFPGLLVSCIFSGIVGLAYLAFDPLVRSLILKKMVLSTSSENFKMWEDPPINPHLKVEYITQSSNNNNKKIIFWPISHIFTFIPFSGLLFQPDKCRGSIYGAGEA